MTKFGSFNFTWTYYYAADVRKSIFREDPQHSLIEVNDYFCVTDEDFIKKALAPQKATYLHDYINDYLLADIGEAAHQLGSDCINDWHNILGSYCVEFSSEADYAKLGAETSYDSYLAELVSDEVAPKIGNEVFSLLFADRELLLEFNKILSDFVKSLKQSDHPQLLASDGKVQRCTYWPQWVRRALMYRDKGHCSLCMCDLTGVIAIGQDDAIDHIVPLNLGGTNDVTNLQLLCQGCNLAKSGDTITTSNKYHLYW